MTRVRWFALALVSLVAVSACNNSAPTDAPRTAANANNVTLALVNQKDYVKTLEGMRGKIVVADIWADF